MVLRLVVHSDVQVDALDTRGDSGEHTNRYRCGLGRPLDAVRGKRRRNLESPNDLEFLDTARMPPPAESH
jgi:hypothetical protein